MHLTMECIRVALDWTFNTNHSGFIVAEALGLYRAAGLSPQWITPDQDNYTLTPAKRLELGLADIALCPMESVISYRTKSRPFPIVAVAALLQEDTSAIVTRERPDIQRPRDLDGKVYASYRARYEDHIVRQMVINDGGKGDLRIIYPARLGIWETVLGGVADATWVFENWESIEAAHKGIALRAFKLRDYGIPYGYSPVFAVPEAAVGERADLLRRFLQATREGFLYAQAHLQETVEWLLPRVPEAYRDSAFLLRSQSWVSTYYGDATTWGHMQEARVEVFLEWLHAHGLESRRLHAADITTSALL